jgi:hypothetical protein
MMNAAGSPRHAFANRQNNPITTFGQVAAHAETFSQTSSLPASFGKYDSFYLSLRSSGDDTRQRQQKQWLRRHQYRGDERVRHGSARRRMNERQQKKYSTSPFSSPQKMEDVYEDDDIEAERDCVGGGEELISSVSSAIDSEICNSHGYEDIAPGEPAQVSPTLSSHAAIIDLHPKITGGLNEDNNTQIYSRKRELPLMDLDDAFMELTLDMNPSIVTPEATSIGENLKKLSPADDTSVLSSSLDPAVNSRSSSLCSNLNAQLESVILSQKQHRESESSGVFFPSPTKSNSICKENYNWTPLCSPDQKNDATTAQQSNQFELTPLSKKIISRRGQFTSSSKASPPKSPASTVTPKRKPQGTISSSSKRRRRESNTTVTSTTPAPRALFNGKAMERIRDVHKCTDKHCRWDPSLHKLKAACERCWTLASDSERKSFVDNGGRHLRINLVKGGCPSSCRLFSHRSKADNGCVGDDEDIRLCRKCFDDMHHVGVRNTGI